MKNTPQMKNIPQVRKRKARANIDHAATIKVHSICYSSLYLRSHYKELKQRGWKFYAVSQTRGNCYYNIKTITIPIWVFSLNLEGKKPGYPIWYISHEMSHAFAGHKAKHGPDFMMWLKIICPKEYQQYELGYKPMHAAKSGIEKQVIHGITQEHNTALDWEFE